MILNKSTLKTANYIIIGLSMLFVLYCWAMHYKAKQTPLNPLIPAEFADIYFKPALLFTGIFSIAVVLQLIGLYSIKWRWFSVIFGAIIVVVAWLLYPYSTGWFLR